MRESTVRQTSKENLRLKLASTEELIEQVGRTCGAIASRAFEIFEDRGRPNGHDVDHWLQAELELLHPVHVRVVESDSHLSVQAEVPGFELEDLEVAAEPKRIVIAGRRETRKDETTPNVIYQERCADQLLRVIDLPVEVDTGKLTATLEYGVLQLVLPKAQLVGNTDADQVRAT